MTSALRFDPGTAVGPYVVERQLARGTTSVTYLARVRSRGADPDRVALKVLLPDATTPATRARMQIDARALASVEHPGVARVHGTGEYQGISWIATEYVRGADLRRTLLDRGPMSPELAVHYAVQIAEALVEAHAAGVIHRELKPTSIVITPEGNAVLVDLGVVRRRPEVLQEDADREAPSPLAYASPEQVEHGLADERSDVWALGCILYEMLALTPPFGFGGAATAAAIVRDDPAFPPTVPVTLVNLIGSCLRKSSFARLGSARECLSMLRDAHVEARTKRSSMRPSTPPPVSSSGMPARPPSISSSRISSSAMRVAVPRGRVKGAALRAGVAWFADTYGEPGLARVHELASPELAGILRADDPAFGIIASGWYETHLVGELLTLIEIVASPADLTTFQASVADAIARDNVGGVYRALFRLVASPPLLEANAQRVWRTYVDEGSLSVSVRRAGVFEARVRGWSRHHPQVCTMIRAMIERLLRAVGYTGLVVEREECVAEGAAHCLFEGTWLP